MIENDLSDSGRRFLVVPHGQLSFPLFMPDATFGVVRSVGSEDLRRCGVQAVVMNVFHLMRHPGSSVIRALGGLHIFSGWDGPIVTDSGGFQAYSIVRRDPKLGSITNKGILFRPEGSSRRLLLTPEKSVRLQLSYGSDLVICLDECTHVSDPFEVQEESVARTISWSKRCKTEFERISKQRRESKKLRPLLFAVIQGGGSLELRKECAEQLLEIGFDGYGYGGYPLDSKGRLLTDIIKFTRELVPAEFPMIALGVGEPSNIRRCAEMGYELFDSSLPTRDARQGRLYVSKSDSFRRPVVPDGGVCSYVYIQDKKHIRSRESISPNCDCMTCSSYTRAYLHHLFKMKDTLYPRLATIHNLRSMTLLMERLKGDRNGNRGA